MSAPFFITGLPRSRTAWLANLFTWGDSFCYHDILPECGSLDQLDANFKVLSQAYLRFGLSDSSVLLMWPALIKRYPESTWVVIKRNVTESCDSFVRYFEQYPYPGMPPLEETAVKWFKVFDDHLSDLLLHLRSNTYPNLFHEIEFEHLSNYGLCRRLLRDVALEHLTLERWKLLNSLRINTLSEIRALPENPKFKQLLNECVLAGNGIDAIRRTVAQCGAGSPLPERHEAELVHNESR